VALTFYFQPQLEYEGNSWGIPLACSVIVVLGTFAELASVASTIVVNKDWIVILADGDQERLAGMNSACRSIDLMTNVIAPVVVGQMLYFLSQIITAIALATWNVVSFAVEIFLLWKIYEEYPNLAVKAGKDMAKGTPHLNNHISFADAEKEAVPKDDSSKKKSWYPIRKFQSVWRGWPIYFNHEIKNAGMGLACLYLTVLGFDSITTSYAYSQGVPEYVLGVLAGIGAIMGLLGSIAFPFMVRRFGVLRTGLYGFGMEVTCLTLCVASVWTPGSPFDPQSVINSTIHVSLRDSRNSSDAYADYAADHSETVVYTSILLLMAGITAARFGLWIADLSVNQILQGVEDEIRGTVNGVQSSMNMIFDTCKFVLVIIFPLPETFGILICISFVAVFSGGMFYAAHCYQQRGQAERTKSVTSIATTQTSVP